MKLLLNTAFIVLLVISLSLIIAIEDVKCALYVKTLSKYLYSFVQNFSFVHECGSFCFIQHVYLIVFPVSFLLAAKITST